MKRPPDGLSGWTVCQDRRQDVLGGRQDHLGGRQSVLAVLPSARNLELAILFYFRLEIGDCD